MKYIILLFSILLASCSATNGISFYSLDNAELESVVKQNLPKLTKELKILRLPVNFSVENVDVKIGPDNRQVIALNLEAKANVSAFVINYPVYMQLNVEGSPYFNSNEDAIYLKDVNLKSASVDAGAYKGSLSALNKEALKIVNDYLDENPIYTLDKSDPTQSLLSKIPLDLKIQENSIKLTPMLSKPSN